MVAISSFTEIRPADLPQPPQTTLEVLRACSREEVTHQEIAQKVSIDPLLTAELLRIVNTPLFGLGKEIQSIQHAVTILGSKALRNVVLCLSIGQVVDEHAFADLDIKPFWEDSLRRAVTARLLATYSDINGDDAFTAGLLQDFGLLVLLHLFPDRQSHWPELRSMTPSERHQQERQLFHHTHETIAAQLMESWGLPENLSQALAHHHDADSSHISPLAYALQLSDWINALFVGHDKNTCLDKIRESLQIDLRLDEAQIETLLTDIPPQLELAAHDLGMDVAEQTEFQQILQNANRRLAAENLSYQELTWQLEHTLNERNRLSAELERELQLARSIQQSLLPTGMPDDFPVFGINLPARQLSGDFFDYFALDDGRIYFNIADVSGKGTHAALLMAKTSSLFRCLGKKKMPLSGLIQTLNAEIYDTNIMGMFVTMTAGCYEPESGTLSLLNAGHLPALLLPIDGPLKTIPAQTPPLGICPQLENLQVTTLTLQQASLYLISDGITETLKKNGKQLGMAGFAMLAKQYQHQPIQQRLQSIVSELQKLNDKQADDITLVAIE